MIAANSVASGGTTGLNGLSKLSGSDRASAESGRTPAEASSAPVKADDKPTETDSVDVRSGVRTLWDTPEAVARNFDASRLVDNVGGALEAALERAAADGAGEKELDAMRTDAGKGVAQGFREAADLIDGLGLMSDELSSTLRTAERSITERLAEGSTAGATALRSVNAASGSVREANDFSFEVRTRDGDVVRISASAERETQISSKQSENGQRSRTSVQWMTADSQSYRLEVDGQLDEREETGLKALLEKVDSIADRFFGGRYEAAFNKAKSLELTDDTLVSMSLNLTRQSVGVAQYQAMQGPADRSNADGDSGNDWLMPIKQYAQTLVDAQQWNASDNWGAETFLDALQAHPKQVQSMTDFADTITRRVTDNA